MEDSNIGWTQHTFNGWRGCTHAILADGSEHPGCQDCYAEAMAPRNPLVLGQWGQAGTRVMAAPQYWRLPLKWNREAEAKGERVRVFCHSLADVFEDWRGPIMNHKGERAFSYSDHNAGAMDGSVAATMDDLRFDLFKLIDATPWLDWLLLTKRPQNIRRMWPTCSRCRGSGEIHGERNADPVIGTCPTCRGCGYRHNVWLITSVSNQQTADEMLPPLVKCHDLVPVLGVSAEPLLAGINFLRVEKEVGTAKGGCPIFPLLSWAIVGGLSGPNWKACGDMVPHIRSVADQCEMSGVACYIKQDAARLPGQQGRIPDELWAVKQFPQPAIATRAK